MSVSELEQARDSLRDVLDRQTVMSAEDLAAIRGRIDMLNSLVVMEITSIPEKGRKADDEARLAKYEEWKGMLLKDRKKFMDINRQVFKGSYPKFVEYFESLGLTSDEINIVCLYALDLSGKHITNFLSRTGHYRDSVDIRRKLPLDGTYLKTFIRNKFNELK